MNSTNVSVFVGGADRGQGNDRGGTSQSMACSENLVEHEKCLSSVTHNEESCCRRYEYGTCLFIYLHMLVIMPACKYPNHTSKTSCVLVICTFTWGQSSLLLFPLLSIVRGTGYTNPFSKCAEMGKWIITPVAFQVIHILR